MKKFISILTITVLTLSSMIYPPPAKADPSVIDNFSDSSKINAGASSNYNVTGGVVQAAAGFDGGDGSDGACSVTSAININTQSCVGRVGSGDAVNFASDVNTSSGSSTMVLATSAAGLLVAGDEVLIINLQGTSGTAATTLGHYEYKIISQVNTTTLTFSNTLTNTYSGATQQIMVQRVPQYTTVTVGTNGNFFPQWWDGNTGGVVAFKANNYVTVSGSPATISANSDGYRAGETYCGRITTTSGGKASTTTANPNNGTAGENAICFGTGAGNGGAGGRGVMPTPENGGLAQDGDGIGTGAGGAFGTYYSLIGNYGGGGGGGGGGGAGGGGGGGFYAAFGGGYIAGGLGSSGYNSVNYANGGGGGGGGYGNAGSGGNGGTGLKWPTSEHYGGGGGGGGGGNSYGVNDLSRIYFGSGGGCGGSGGYQAGGCPWPAGGIIIINAPTITVTSPGTITSRSDGINGTNYSGQGGQSSGGSILLTGNVITLGTGLVHVGGWTHPSSAGARGGYGGRSGEGRAAIKYVTSYSGTASPTGLGVVNYYQIAGGYKTSGTVTSTNLFSGVPLDSITSFDYNLSSLPAGSTANVQFSQNTTDWYNSLGTLNASSILSAGAGNISLSNLNWTGSNFYYRFVFTTNGTTTPTLTSVGVQYKSTAVSDHFLDTTKINTGASSNYNVTASTMQVGDGFPAGNGADGTCTSNININTQSCVGRGSGDGVNFDSNVNTSAGSSTIVLASTPTGLAVNDEVLIINLQGTSGDYANVGQYEFKIISQINTNTLTFTTTLTNAYNGTTQKIMVQRVPNYIDVIGRSITTNPWNGNLGGVVAFKATGTYSGGAITVTQAGYRSGETYCGRITQYDNGGKGSGTSFSPVNSAAGAAQVCGSGGGNGGAAGATNNGTGVAGGGGDTGTGASGAAGLWYANNTHYPSGGGGAGSGGAGGGGGGGFFAAGGGGYDPSLTLGGYTNQTTNLAQGGGGGGGGYGTAGGGGNGGLGISPWPGYSYISGGGGGGGGGGTYGVANLSKLYLGSGGGAGGNGGGYSGGAGAIGAGIVIVNATTITTPQIGAWAFSGSVASSGAGGSSSGGSILLTGKVVDVNSTINYTGVTGSNSSGTRGGKGGNGGAGRAAIRYVTSTSGTTNPTTTPTQIAASYQTSGTIVSTNLLASSDAGAITSFSYNMTSLPAGSSGTIQFSNNNTTWYNSSGTLNGTNSLASGSQNISLTSLNWIGNNFYYRITYTTNGTVTPALDSITVNYNSDSSCLNGLAGNGVIVRDCYFPTAHVDGYNAARYIVGVDSGTGASNTATLTLSSGTLLIYGTQTVIAGSFILNGGSISMSTAGAQLIPGGLMWVPDADADGYPNVTNKVYPALQGTGLMTGYSRRGQIISITQVDSNDGLNTVH